MQRDLKNFPTAPKDMPRQPDWLDYLVSTASFALIVILVLAAFGVLALVMNTEPPKVPPALSKGVRK